MKYQELVVLAPCHSLEDFPLYYTGDDAAGLLAAWTALWDPRLLASARKMPRVQRAEMPGETPANQHGRPLLVVPPVSEKELDLDFVEQAASQGAVIVRHQLTRAGVVAEALRRASEEPANEAAREKSADGATVGPDVDQAPPEPPANDDPGPATPGRVEPGLDRSPAVVDVELIADFYALGFCYLQVALLTRQMRYSSSIDESRFRTELLAAVDAASASDSGTAREHLARCFDLLSDERTHYYPVDVYLLDITLVAESTLGEPLRSQLSAPHVGNLLLSGKVAEYWAGTHPESLEALRRALAEERFSLIGGEFGEAPLPLLHPDSIAAEFASGKAAYEAANLPPPRVYGRRRFGLIPELVGALQANGFRGAWHVTLDEGQFPLSSQHKTRWQSPGGMAIDALARPPLDASLPETFLNLPVSLSETMDRDHVATGCFAHWPGRSHESYDDLRRACQFAPVLGRFVTIDEYFGKTGDTGHRDPFQNDHYRSPYLSQAADSSSPDPISQWTRYWKRRVHLSHTQGLLALVCVLQPKHPQLKSLANQIEQTARATGDALGSGEMGVAPHNIEAALESASQACLAALTRLLAPTAADLPARPTSSTTAEDAAGEGPPCRSVTILNPLSFSSRCFVNISSMTAGPLVEKPVYAVDVDREARRTMLVDVPAMGVARISARDTDGAPARSPAPEIASEFKLRNEFLQVHVDPATGAVRSVADYSSRGTRLSQQLAIRVPPPKTGQPWIDRKLRAVYSVMAADRVEIRENTSIRGEIFCEGRLVDERGSALATFQQLVGLQRGSRILTLDIRIDPRCEFSADPWESYLAHRIAWSDDGAILHAGTRLHCAKTEAKRIEAPLLLDVDSANHHTYLFTAGLPYHRRAGLNRLDTILLTRDETARQFRLGIGLDLPQPIRSALDFMAPPPAIWLGSASPSAERGASPTSWFFHLDAKNVVVTAWEPIFGVDRATGLRIRLVETEGRQTKCGFHACVDLRQATVVNDYGERQSVCLIEQGVALIDVPALQWVNVEIFFGDE